MDGFQFKLGDVVLAEWTDKLFYAKILHINRARLTCTLLFDDDSIEECPISKLHSVTETTADIVCIICKDGSSSEPNEIVLCDKCGVGYHQKCHEPSIEDNALEPEAPWMCVYCSSGTECPYLLNPFDAKLKNFTTSSRKHRGVTKATREIRHVNTTLCIPRAKIDEMDSNSLKYLLEDGYYGSERKTEFGHKYTSDRVRTLMGDYYDRSYPRPGIGTSRPRGRNMIGDHRVISRRAMVDGRLPGDSEKEIYELHERYDRGRERSHRDIESFSKKRRMAQQQKRTTQDVWDNGYTSRDGMRTAEKLETNKTKVSGKDGPREKQRLTQDLERQRKKLQEDMERGQELQREHSQLLTRDLSRAKNGDITKEDPGTDFESDVSRRQDRRLYSREWTEDENEANSWNKGDSAVDSKTDDSAHAKFTNSLDNDHGSDLMCSSDVKQPDKEDLGRYLDPCGCDEERCDVTGRGKIKEDVKNAQCEHSSCGDDDCDSSRMDVTHESTSTAKKLVAGLKEESMYELNIKDTTSEDRVFTSEKVEVIGRSDDLSGYYNEINKERPNGRGKPRRNGPHGKHSGRGHSKKCHKLSGCKSNDENGQEGKGSLLEYKTRKTKEGNGGRSGGSRTNKESLKDNTTSSAIDQQTAYHAESETMDEDEGGSKEPGKGKSHATTPEGKKTRDVDVQDDITQDRVRSDLPRHNWLIHRWLNQKNHPSGMCGPSGGAVKVTRQSSDDVVKDSKGEVTSSTSPEEPELVKAPAHSTTSPVLEDKLKETVVSETDSGQAYKNELPGDEATNLENDPNESASPTFKLLSPVKAERSLSPQRINNISPELKRLSPNLVPASPCEDNEERKNRPSPLLKVPALPRNIWEGKRKSRSSRDTSEDQENCEESKLDQPGRLDDGTFNETRSGRDSDDNSLRIVADGKELNDKDTAEEKVIEIKSDGEGNEDLKNSSEFGSKEGEGLKISTGKSVNPVSPFRRTQHRKMDESRSGIHGTRHHDMIPRSPGIPSDLPHTIPFSYLPGYSPKTFTPHLITHNTHSAQSMAAPVSPVVRHAGHAGHGTSPSRVPCRMDFGPHSKPDMNCPFHGKKATEKIIPYAPGYPMIHSDHILGRIPLHEGPPDAAALKLREKHVDFPSDPLAVHRRLSSVYDNHRHLMMPHGIHGHAHLPHYFGPGMTDEHSLHIERERFKRRIETVYPLPESARHVHSSPSEELRNASRYTVSPTKEKRDIPKHITSPSGNHRHEDKHTASPLTDTGTDSARAVTHPGAAAGQYRQERYQGKIVTRRLSSHDVKYPSHSDVHSSAMPGKHSPTAIGHGSHNATKEHRSAFIELGGKKSLEKSGIEASRLSNTLDQESISRNFNERFNILKDKTFREKMEGVTPGEDSAHKTRALKAYRRTPPLTAGLAYDGIPRKSVSPSPRDVEPYEYRKHEIPRSPGQCRESPPSQSPSNASKSEPESRRGLLSVSSQKPTLPSSSYRSYGDIVSSMATSPKIYGELPRDRMKKSPDVRRLPHLARLGENPGHYEHLPWPLTSQGRGAGIPSEESQISPTEKREREKAEYISSKRELQEKEMSLALEKHRINLAHLENERRKVLIMNERTHGRLPSRPEVERNLRARPENADLDLRSPRVREELLRREREEAGSRKRKFDDIMPEVLAVKDRISPYRRTTDVTKRVPGLPKDDRGHPHVPEDMAKIKERYLATYGKVPPERYGQHMTTVPYPGGARTAGNAPFYMSHFDLQRAKQERSVNEALRKQREFNEEQVTLRKRAGNEDLGTSEPAKKRTKALRMCGVCGKEASFLCSGCQKAWYCSHNCQVRFPGRHTPLNPITVTKKTSCGSFVQSL